MNDRFLCRAKRTDDGEWVEGFYAVIREKTVIIEREAKNFYDVDGGKNSHGNKIVEVGFYFNVLLEDGGFEEEYIYDYQDWIEVIGNIIDNPELLEV